MSSDGVFTGSTATSQPHIPVMLMEVLSRLGPEDDETYIDATFGAGGYTSAILDAADCKVLALDRDPSAVKAGFDLALAYDGRLSLMQLPFSILDRYTADPDPDWETTYVAQYDGVVFDLGVSSMQLDQDARGFSFQVDGPLDMRMFHDGGATPPLEGGPTAADIVNTADAALLADIIFQLGEEKRSRRIAEAIVARRSEKPFERTLDLADVVEKVLGGRRGDARHPATKTFQALRMYVNDELGELVRGLAGAERCLKPGGRLVVVTFHSLEDRIVKRFMAKRSGKDGGVSRHMPVQIESENRPSLKIVNHPPLTSSKGELDVNPRARSARLRSAVRTDAAPWPFDASDLGVPAIVRSTL
ncbi:MAG: 16S rRNA (cytosine(1402)-N(4))-methyltransferase RsmH [Pseudomonadota bacterium]